MLNGRRIKELREAAGLSQEKFAAKAGLTHATVSDVENGKRNVTLMTILKLAKALGVPLLEIMVDEEEVTNGQD